MPTDAVEWLEDWAVDWLEDWANENMVSPGSLDETGKSSMRETAKACLAAAELAGYTVKQIKDAAGGDLESYLLNRQALVADDEVESASAKDD